MVLSSLGRVVGAFGLVMALGPGASAQGRCGMGTSCCIDFEKPVRQVTGYTQSSVAAGINQHVIIPGPVQGASLAWGYVAVGNHILLGGGGGEPQELLTVKHVQPSRYGYVEISVDPKYPHMAGSMVGPALEGGYCAPLCAPPRAPSSSL